MLIPLGHVGKVDLGTSSSGSKGWHKPGEELPQVDAPIRQARRKVNYTTCQHLVGATDESTLILKPKGCGGCSQKETTIWECSLHGDCAPLAIGIVADETVLDCRKCADFSPRV